jgi:hypothetical protein
VCDVRHATIRINGFVSGLALSAALALGLAPAAQAASAPGAYTSSASDVTATTAKLSGSVNPNGQGTNYYFEYGTTSKYGAVTPLSPAGNATQGVHVSASVTGLAANTTYHYRIVTENASGVIPGGDRTFTTAKIPLTFALSLAPLDVYGSPLTVSGVLSGTGAPDHAVVLQENPFPYVAGFKTVGNPELTDGNGYFAFPGLTLASNTQLRVSTLDKTPALSRVALEPVAVRVTLHVKASGAGFARFYGTVMPGQGLARVYFQLVGRGRSPHTLTSIVIDSRGAATHFSRRVRIRHAGLYRAYVQVASGELTSGHSHPLRIG